MNAQLGKDNNHPYAYHRETNRNGQSLSDFITENELISLNTKFQKKPSKLWTHTYAHGMKAQLDYMFVNKKWINSIVNSEAYNTFEGVISDHRIVSLKIRLSLRANKLTKSSTPCYDWSALSNQNTRYLYTVAVRNRFDALQSETESTSANTMYENFIEAHNYASKNAIPLKRKMKRKIPWETEAITEKRNILKSAANRKNAIPTRASARLFVDAQKDLVETYESEQAKYVQERIDTINNAHANNQSSLAWKTINDISGRKRSNKAKLKADSQQQRLDKWKTHFQNLLGKTPVVSDEPIETVVNDKLQIKQGNFTEDELSVVLKDLKTKKAAGPDSIPPEVWKTEAFNDIILKLCNAMYNGESIEKWSEGCILPFPKKGDLSDPKNYRGITLTPIAAKIYNSLLLNRIQPVLDNILRDNQNGFRKKRSTVSQILTIRRIIEGVKARNLPAVLLFVDFSKAFDSVHRGKMEKIMLAYGIPHETVSAIMMLYKNTKSKVRSPDGDTDYFDINAGVLQGDTLAPFLFVLCLDYVLRNSVDKINQYGFTLKKAASRRHPAVKITDADYADDLALISDSIDGASAFLHSLEYAAANIGLHVNATKTEFICYNQQGEINTVSGEPLKSVNSFNYLGSNISSSAKDVEIRIAKAWIALDSLKAIWKSTLTNDMKRSFFQATVESVLLYGSTTWTLTKTLEAKLDGTYTRMLRAVLDLSWRDHPNKQQLYGDLPPISIKIRQRRMRFAGHCWRSKRELVSSTLLWKPTHGHAGIGRPPTTFIDQLCRDTGCNPNELPAAMDDRIRWRNRVEETRASST